MSWKPSWVTQLSLPLYREGLIKPTFEQTVKVLPSDSGEGLASKCMLIPSCSSNHLLGLCDGTLAHAVSRYQQA